MKLFIKISLLYLLALSCLSCSQKPVQIVNRGKILYSKNNSYNKEKYRDIKQNGNLKNYKTATGLSNKTSGVVEVSSGDTLFSISKKYQVPLRDLIEQNHLAAPYNLKSGTKLTIPSATYYEVKAGDTLYTVSRTYNMNIDGLVELNNLKPPYQLKAGQKIKISKQSENNVTVTNLEPPVSKAQTIKIQIKEKAASANFVAKNLVEKTIDKLNHFSWPVRGEIISRFGPKKGGLYNDGINIKAKEGETVKASEDGVVAYVGNELKGYGNLIIIKHSGGWITAYAHLSKTSVQRGQKVKKFDKIAEVGASGKVSFPQLYFGLRKGRDAVNPENYLRK